MQVNKYVVAYARYCNVVINREQVENESAEKNAAVPQLFCFLLRFCELGGWRQRTEIRESKCVMLCSLESRKYSNRRSFLYKPRLCCWSLFFADGLFEPVRVLCKACLELKTIRIKIIATDIGTTFHLAPYVARVATLLDSLERRYIRFNRSLGCYVIQNRTRIRYTCDVTFARENYHRRLFAAM